MPQSRIPKLGLPLWGGRVRPLPLLRWLLSLPLLPRLLLMPGVTKTYSFRASKVLILLGQCPPLVVCWILLSHVWPRACH